MKRTAKIRRIYFSIAVLAFVLDQITKAIVVRNVRLYDQVTVIPGFFHISHVLNRGAAFSIFADSHSQFTTIGLILFSVAVMSAVAALLWRGSRELTCTGVGLSLILGGAMGNLVDRVLIGSVVDFLAFHLWSYHWPDFNMADSAIVIGSLLLIGDVFFARRETPGAEPAS